MRDGSVYSGRSRMTFAKRYLVPCANRIAKEK
jgi:hypothetical protein